MTYGIPYTGSKNRLAKDIVNILPEGKRLVDLFCGGCAITHCAMLSGKYDQFLINDINGQMPQLFMDAIAGKYKDERRWISYEEFHRLKDTDAYIATCWSFGNNMWGYLYARSKEPYKRAMHYAVVFDEWDEFAKLYPDKVEEAKNLIQGMPNTNWEEIKLRRLKLARQAGYRQLQGLERLERLQGLESLRSTERLNKVQSLAGCLSRIQMTSMSYENYEYQEGDVVYCDIPYKDAARPAAKYMRIPFDYDKFWDWARTRKFPVYVSEYQGPDDFEVVFQKTQSKLGGPNGGRNGQVLEKVFYNRAK